MRFTVRTVQPGDSSVIERLMDAQSELALREALRSDGLIVLTIRPQESTVGWGPLGLRLRRPRPNYPVFCREIRTLVQAGMTVVEAVQTLCAQHQIERRAPGLAEWLLAGLERGQSLSTTMRQLPDAPAVLIASVQAGERTSDLATALDEYLRYDELVTQLKRKVISAAIYPALVCGIAVAISLFLLIVVIPRFARMYESLRSNSTESASPIIWVSQVVAQHQFSLILTTVVLAVAGLYWLMSGRLGRLALAISGAIPWVHKRIVDFDLAMLYQALALLVRGGYPMVDALVIAGNSCQSESLRQLVRASSVHIERGRSVAASFSDAKLCDEVGRRLLAAAERNGQFYKAAEVVGRMHAQRFELFVERVTRIVEPVLLLGVTLLVGSIVIVMYQPVFDMAIQFR